MSPTGQSRRSDRIYRSGATSEERLAAVGEGRDQTDTVNRQRRRVETALDAKAAIDLRRDHGHQRRLALNRPGVVNDRVQLH